MQGLGFPLLYMVMSVHGSLLTDQKLKLIRLIRILVLCIIIRSSCQASSQDLYRYINFIAYNANLQAVKFSRLHYPTLLFQ